MLRAICCVLLVAHSSLCVSQGGESNLEKGKELLHFEGYRLSAYHLNLAISTAKKKTTRNEARFFLVECLLLQQELDSAAHLLEQFKGDFLPNKFAYLVAVQKFHSGSADAVNDFEVLANGSSRDPLLKAKINYYLGVLYYRQRTSASIEESIRSLKKSIGYFQIDSGLMHLKIGICRMQLADALRVAGQMDAAFVESQRALLILQVSPYATATHLANAYNTEGRIHFDSNRYFKAAAIFEKSLKIRLASRPDSAATGVTFSNLAACYDLLNDQNNCERSYEEAALYWRTLRNQPNRTIPFTNNRALFLQSIQESATALRILEGILPQANGGSIQWKFTTNYNLATLYYNLSEFEKARQVLGTLLNLRAEQPGQLSIADEVRISRLHAMLLSKEDKILDAIGECKNIDKIINTGKVNAKDAAAFHSAFADILMTADSFEVSKSYLHRAGAYYGHAQDLSASIENNNALAMACFQLRQYDSTVFYANRSMEENAISSKGLIYPYRLPMEAIQACFITIAARTKQFEKSGNASYLSLLYPFEQLGIDLIRSMRKNLYSDVDRIYYNKSVAKFYEAIQFVHFYRIKRGDDANLKFFEYVEESKFQALSNSMSAARVNSFKEVNERLLSEEKQLAKKKVLENNQLVQLLSTSEDAEEIEGRRVTSLARLSMLQREHQSFLDSVRQHFTGYYELKYGAEPLTLSKFQQQLTPNQLVLQWKVLDSIILLQSIHRNHVTIYRIGDPLNVSKQIKKLRNQIKFKLDSDLISTAQLLYKELLSTAFDDIKERKESISDLVIVPDGVLYLLPFEVLVNPRSQRGYLIESYDVRYAYSCQLMMQGQWQKSEEAQLGFLGIAPTFNALQTVAVSRSSLANASDVKYDEFGFQPLQENEGEVMAIGNVVPRKNATLLRGEAATESRVKKVDLIRYKYIHFATHGFVDVSGQGSGLALTNADASEDNLLMSAEIYNLALRAELVCLSACETGLGNNANGEGLMGLGRAFFYAGARNLLVSLWKVPDRSTALFMVDFYQTLFVRQLSMASSLRAAKLKMIKSSEYHSPHYWAPFVLIGSN